MLVKYQIILFITTILVFLMCALQYFWHKKRLKKIPIRIHVNGTRGKSSVTRLIAAGLRAGGIRTCAKTTGTLPRMIMPDGREYPIFRPGKANIAEQVRVVRSAAAQQAKALVIECMALQPYLQWVSEDKMIKATHGVITNIRADHLDVMGPTELDVARALVGMIPQKQECYTAESRYLDVIQSVCDDRKSKCIAVDKNELLSVSEEEMKGFSYIEHTDNVALALKVCLSLGVDREKALKGMHKAHPDPGALIDFEVDFFGRKIYFINGFAANDPESTQKIWDIALSRYSFSQTKIALFNCRVDRPDRSIQLAEHIATWGGADYLVVMGTGTYLFAKTAVKAGYDYHQIYYADDNNVEEIFEMLVGLSKKHTLIVGMGNIGGQGLELVQHFKNRSILKEVA